MGTTHITTEVMVGCALEHACCYSATLVPCLGLLGHEVGSGYDANTAALAMSNRCSTSSDSTNYLTDHDVDGWPRSEFGDILYTESSWGLKEKWP